MIILRQKEFSGLSPEERLFHVRFHGIKAAKLSGKKLGNEISNSFHAFRKSRGEVALALNNATPQERLQFEAKFAGKFKHPTRQQLMREAIDSGETTGKRLVIKGEKLKRTLTTKQGATKAVLRGATKAERFISSNTPGSVVAKLGGTLAENPIGSIGTAVGNGIMATGIVIPGTTEASWALEGLAKKSRKYKVATERAGNFYRKNLDGIIRGGVDEFVQALPK